VSLLRARTLPELAELAGTERPGAVGFIAPWEGGFRPIAYEEWWGRIERLSAALRGSGLLPGDRALLLMETRYEWLICDLAILCCGAWTVPLYSSLPAAQLAHPIADSTPRIAIVSRPELLARLLAAPGAADTLRAVYLLDGVPPPVSPIPIIPVSEACDGARPGAAEERALREIREGIGPDDPSCIIYTSGTSTAPKGVLLSHANILSNARMIAEALPIGSSDRCLAVLPLAHSLERTAEYATIAAGGVLAYGRGIESLARDAMAVRPTVLLGVPRLFEQILSTTRGAARERGRLAGWLFEIAESVAERRGGRGPRMSETPTGPVPRQVRDLWDRLFFRALREKLGGQVRWLVSGSAPLARREALFFCGAGLPLLEGYGLTEAGSAVSVNRLDRWRAGTVGPPLPGVELRIAEDGEILVRGPGVMRGYYNQEAATREALEEGWLHTGDLGRLDNQGFLSLTGRKKDLIVTSGGKNISPAPIEDRLKESPWIEEAVVFGDRRPYLVALILPDRSATLAHLREHGIAAPAPQDVWAVVRKVVDRVNHDLAPHERIRSFDLLASAPSVEAGTLTPTLKVRRGALEAACIDQLSALYETTRR